MAGAYKYPVSPEQHEEIRCVYQCATGDNQVNDLAARLDLPRWKITRYAIENGWIAKQKKEPIWGPEELRLLKAFARYTPPVIRRKLMEQGYTRSAQGIVLKRKRMGMLKDLGGMSATRLAACLGVDRHFVMRAISEKSLRAEKRETRRTPQQGGDSWFIRDADIGTYIIANLHEIDIRKVDKYWFVRTLTGIPRQQQPTHKDLPEPEQRSIPFDDIHENDEYFLCTRMSCTLRKLVCIRRQTEVLKDGTGHIMTECWNCEQGRQIAAELGVAVDNPRPEDLQHKSFRS